jgi:hypothetical protein
VLPLTSANSTASSEEAVVMAAFRARAQRSHAQYKARDGGGSRAFQAGVAARRRRGGRQRRETTVINLAEVPLQPAGSHLWDDAALATAERQLARLVEGVR